MDDNTLIEVSTKLNSVLDGIDSIKEKQDALASDISKIKEAVYNPDEGLYARLKALEGWKETSTRLTWIIVTTLAGLGTATMWNMLINHSKL